MVTDRRVTKGGSLHDGDANKNILFGDRNAVVTVGYTGHAYIGKTPTDQWIAQTLTELTFKEGRRERSAPLLSATYYEQQYIGIRIRKLRDQLNEIRSLIPHRYRNAWIADPFDILITGFEWNHGKVRPLLVGLSKPRSSNTFALFRPDRRWFFSQGNRYPAQMYAAPAENISSDKLQRISSRLDAVWRDGHGTPEDIADDAEILMAETFREISDDVKVVGPDLMSIQIPAPIIPNPTIRVRYISENALKA